MFVHACATWSWVTRSTMDCCLKWYKFKLRCVIVKGYWHARVYSLRGEFSNFKGSDTHIIWTLGVTTNKPFYVKWVLPSAEIQSSIQNTKYKIQLKIIQPRDVYIYIIGGKKNQNGRFVSSSNLAKLYSNQYCLSKPLDPFYILSC